jgi:hypothetical protein
MEARPFVPLQLKPRLCVHVYVYYNNVRYFFPDPQRTQPSSSSGPPTRAAAVPPSPPRRGQAIAAQVRRLASPGSLVPPTPHPHPLPDQVTPLLPLASCQGYGFYQRGRDQLGSPAPPIHLEIGGGSEAPPVELRAAGAAGAAGAALGAAGGGAACWGGPGAPAFPDAAWAGDCCSGPDGAAGLHLTPPPPFRPTPVSTSPSFSKRSALTPGI